jgi:SAM-dependent methyltransferase
LTNPPTSPRPSPSPLPSWPTRSPAPKLGPSDAAIYETFVVPRYMTLFGDLLLDMLAEGSDAQVVHLECKTGYPDRGIAAKLEGAHIYGVDASTHAIELARAKAQTMPGMVADYRVADSYPAPLPDGAFSHGFALHPLVAPEARQALLTELARLVATQGQALVAMPMRGSFLEIADLLREYALKKEVEELGKAVEAAMLLRPTADDVANEMRAVGFDFVEVEVRSKGIGFTSGRDFFEDPISRLVLLPELSANLGSEELSGAFVYLREAIDKYWSDATFTLTVSVGCVSGRRV